MAKEREKREKKKLDIKRHKDKKKGLERQTEQEKDTVGAKSRASGPWRDNHIAKAGKSNRIKKERNK